MLDFSKIKRIVIKVGTSTLTYPSGMLNIRCIEKLVRCISDLQNRGFEIVLVSSGAIGVGAAKMKLTERPQSLKMKQAAAAVGQCELMHIYDKMFLEYNHVVAQILLTKHDVADYNRRQYVHNTFDALIDMKAIPIVNENDSVSVDEIEFVETFGDNDTLSAIVTKISSSDLLIIFTDIDGLYDSDPRKSDNAKLIKVVHKITPEIEEAAGGAGSANGTGGMITKLKAANICLDAKIPMIIVNGQDPDIIYDIVEGKQPGTLFLP